MQTRTEQFNKLGHDLNEIISKVDQSSDQQAAIPSLLEQFLRDMVAYNQSAKLTHDRLERVTAEKKTLPKHLKTRYLTTVSEPLLEIFDFNTVENLQRLLTHFVVNGDINSITLLMEHGLDIGKFNLLHEAIKSVTGQQVALITLLLKKGASITFRTVDNDTPLTFALKQDSPNLDVINLFLTDATFVNTP